MIEALAIYGDSISAGTHGEGGYATRLQVGLGINRVYNHAICGSGLSLATPNSGLAVLRTAANRHLDAGHVLLWHGSNDWYWGVALGKPGCGDPATFLGAMEEAVSIQRRSCPGAKILWPTPLWRYQRPEGGREDGEGWNLPNKNGVTLAEITAAILENAPRLGYTALPMRDYVHINEANQAQYLEDRIHPNKAGYSLIWPALAAGLRDI